ncbi:MAG: Gx transporter family protein [Oscillospiraceae bacterium]|nr:Gx transporter family protein [Oscillospiraceae bacterium]
MMIPKKMSAARYAALMGLIFALAGALNTLENLLSVFLPAGMRVGLSNIVIMAAILCINLPSAAALVLLKAMLVLFTRGVTAGVMSLCGSMAAFLVTALLFRRTRCSYILISVLGAIAHSAGQLCAAAVILGTAYTFAYAPVLIFASVGTGIFTGIVLKAVFPILQKSVLDAKKQ